MKEHTISIVGTHRELLSDNEEITIETKQQIIERLSEILQNDFGYSLIIAEYPENKKESWFNRIWNDISFWRIQAIVSNCLLVFILITLYLYVIPILYLL